MPLQLIEKNYLSFTTQQSTHQGFPSSARRHKFEVDVYFFPAVMSLDDHLTQQCDMSTYRLIVLKGFGFTNIVFFCRNSCPVEGSCMNFVHQKQALDKDTENRGLEFQL